MISSKSYLSIVDLNTYVYQKKCKDAASLTVSKTIFLIRPKVTVSIFPRSFVSKHLLSP